MSTHLKRASHAKNLRDFYILVGFKAFDLESLTIDGAYPVFALLYIIFPIPAILFASTIR